MDWPGEKLLIRLWETITEKSIGSLLRPWIMKREGRTRLEMRCQKILALAQAEQDAEDIKSGRKKVNAEGQLIALPPPIPTSTDSHLEAPENEEEVYRAICQTPSANVVAAEVRREVNVAKASLAAQVELENDPQEPPTRSVDSDWLFRWRDCAGNVSADELQKIWGRVLAGEIKAPGSFSMRTLEFLKNLSQEEALGIAKLSRFVIDDFIFRGNEKWMDAEGAKFGFLLWMQQLGVIADLEAGGLQLTLDSTEAEKYVRGLVSHGRILLVTNDDHAKKIVLRVAQMTTIGRQINRLGTFEPHEDYLRSVGETIKSQGFKVQIARYVQTTETYGNYFDPDDV